MVSVGCEAGAKTRIATGNLPTGNPLEETSLRETPLQATSQRETPYRKPPYGKPPTGNLPTGNPLQETSVRETPLQETSLRTGNHLHSSPGWGVFSRIKRGHESVIFPVPSRRANAQSATTKMSFSLSPAGVRMQKPQPRKCDFPFPQQACECKSRNHENVILPFPSRRSNAKSATTKMLFSPSPAGVRMQNPHPRKCDFPLPQQACEFKIRNHKNVIFPFPSRRANAKSAPTKL
jgi:hypothetical protein